MPDLFRPLNEGYEFNGNDFFSEGWSLFKKESWSFIGITVLFILVSVVLNYVPWVKHLSTFIQMLMFGGYYVFLRNMESGTQKTSDFLAGFKHYAQIAAHLVVFGLMIVPVFVILFSFFIPLGDVFSFFIDGYDQTVLTAGMIESPALFILATISIVCYALYLTVSYFFVLPLIVDAKLGFWQAMELSRRVVTREFFSFLGFYILFAIGAVIFVIVTIGLGIFVVYPLLYCTAYVMYKRIFKLYEDYEMDEIESFGQQVRDINTESQERDFEE